MKQEQNKDVRINTRLTQTEMAELQMICHKTGIKSPYKMMQILLRWFLSWFREMTTLDKEAIQDSIRAEIEEEFNHLAEDMDPRGHHFTTDRRNGR